MEKIILSGVSMVLAIFLLSQCNSIDNKMSKRNVSFFEVPLVCGAAPNIGCGSKSKPILLGLEEQEEITEAWLNRPGTIIAIVWNKSTDIELRNNAADEIFKKNKIKVEEINGNQYENLSTEFENKKDWLRGEEVDQLSKEEANQITERLVARTSHKTPLAKDKSENLTKELVKVFTTRFTKRYL